MNFEKVKHGIYGGLLGGLVFGILMGMMGMLTMIGQMMGMPSAAFGFLVHMMISAFIGASFAVLFGGRIASKTRGLVFGLFYGGIWWLLGPLTLMPLMTGMGFGTNWNSSAAAQMLPSLMGHLIYGGILGWTYAWLSPLNTAHRHVHVSGTEPGLAGRR